jgi:hypothetical protein
MTDDDNAPEAPTPSANVSEQSAWDDDPVMLVDPSIPLGEAEALLGSAGPPRRTGDDDG